MILCLLCGGWMFSACLTLYHCYLAPRGWEDETGFHFAAAAEFDAPLAFPSDPLQCGAAAGGG